MAVVLTAPPSRSPVSDIYSTTCMYTEIHRGSRAAPQHQAARSVSDVIVPAVAGFGHKRPRYRGVPSLGVALVAGPGEEPQSVFLMKICGRSQKIQ